MTRYGSTWSEYQAERFEAAWDIPVEHAGSQHGADVARYGEAEGFQLGQRGQDRQERA